MKLYEYESKKIFSLESIPVAKSILINRNSPQAGLNFLKQHHTVVLKSQVLTGGRCKAGGIRFVSSEEEFIKNINELKVEKILVEEKLNIKTELYLGFTYEKSTGKIILIFSTRGGIEIEEAARLYPEDVIKLKVDILDKLQIEQFKPYFGGALKEFSDKTINKILDVVVKLSNIFVNYDAEVAEINPLVITQNDDVIACDARISIYDDALPKQRKLHPIFADIFDRIDESLTELEKQARKYELGYIEMDGEIGVIGNGAGLNLATLDMLKYRNLNPANFLEVSGRTYSKADKALEIILKKTEIKLIFGNFFGCISRCDVIAKGLISALEKNVLPENIPMIIAMRGNGAEEGVKLIREKFSHIEVFNDDEAAINRIKEILQI